MIRGELARSEMFIELDNFLSEGKFNPDEILQRNEIVKLELPKEPCLLEKSKNLRFDKALG